jgi:signal transduction histidine kinase
MRQRAEDIQGRLDLRTSPGRGTTVEFSMEFSSQ